MPEGPSSGKSQSAQSDVLFAHVASILLVREWPFPAPHPDLRHVDPTRTLSPDARRALLRAAQRRAPDQIEPVIEPKVSLTPRGNYASRTTFDLWLGARFRDDDARREAVRAWPWAGSRNLSEFYRQYPFLHPDADSDPLYEEHYLERRFLQEAFLKVLGEAGLRRVHPQYQVPRKGGGPWEIDFVLRGEKDYAIECDGSWKWDKYQNPKFDPNRLSQRGRDLEAAGLQSISFTYDDILSGHACDEFEKLCRRDMLLRELIGLPVMPMSPRLCEAVDLINLAAVTIRQLHYVLLAELRAHSHSGGTYLRLAITGDEHGLVAIAAADLLSLIRAVAALRGAPVPPLSIHLSYPASWNTRESLLPDFFDNPNWSEDGRDCRLDPLPADSLLVDQSVMCTRFDLGWPEPRRAIYAHHDRLRSNLKWLRAAAINPEPLDPSKETLDFFARWFFPHIAELKDKQVEVIRNHLQDRSDLVILPTAFGKSLCFQLPALLRGGLSVIVSPLRSLMADQIESLQYSGIAAAVSVSGQDAPEQKAAKLGRVRGNRIRLLYIAPERILVDAFDAEVAQNGKDWRLWALVIDEAHCVSEWGHDFRPAYLAIDNFRRRLKEFHAINVLALTATASELVESDIRQTLGITSETIRHGSDRPEISLSVHQVAGDSSRDDLLAEVLGSILPQALQRTPEGLYRSDTEKHGVVVFGPYANPKGKTTIPLGLLHIQRELERAGVLHEGESRIHSSQVVEHCSACASQLFDGASGQCGTCQASREPIYKGNWLDEVGKRQREFKDNDFPVMIATKGYGMGIDKRNIRGIVHAAFSSGIEGYYQESGRAARDGKHGHAALVYSPPHPNCVSEHLAAAPDPQALGFLRTVEPPCIANLGNRGWPTCEYGLSQLCDFGLQANFIRMSYPGVERDIGKAAELYRDIARGRNTLPLGGEDDGGGANATEIAIYRLIQIGFLKHYTRNHFAKKITIDRSDSWSIELGKVALRESLHRLVLRETDRSEQRARIDRLVAELPEHDEHTAVGAMLRLLIEHTYDAVKSMRYRMLHNEWRYACNADKLGCRRWYLLKELNRAPSADTRCEFCDICREVLAFEQGEAVVPITDETLERLAARLPALLQEFDLSAIVEYVDAFEVRGAIAGIQVRAQRELETAPSNQSALVLAGEASARRGLHDEALSAYAEAFRLNEIAPRDEERAYTLFERVRAINPAFALDLIDRRDGILNTVSGRRFLCEQIARTLPPDDPRHALADAHVLLDELEASLPSDLLTSARTTTKRFSGV